MIILVYSETTEQTLKMRLGRAEYSYYFVRKEFEPILHRLGKVIAVDDPRTEVDPIYFDAARRGEPCVFLSFSPPHRTPFGLACPTIPVVAWEFDTIATETWYYECEQDWRYVLNLCGRAITHSADSVRAIKAAMGADYPVVSIPAPSWDRFASRYRARSDAPVATRATLSVSGGVIDTRRPRTLSGKVPSRRGRTMIELDGIVYLSIFNPKDRRKNSADMIDGFCNAFRDVEDATLVLKLSHTDLKEKLEEMCERLEQLVPYKCRVLMLANYLEADAYEKLVAAASFAVNTSKGEGQCLPMMELMSCGKPAVAPSHTGMADYIDADHAFVLRCSAAEASWPQDPRLASRALGWRLDFESLVAAYRESYRVAKEEPERYGRMAQSAHEALQRHCSSAVAVERLKAFLDQPPRPPAINPGYGQVNLRVDVPWDADIGPGLRCLNYYPAFESSVLAFARRGMKVDAVASTKGLRDAARELAKRNPIDLSLYDGEVGFNPAGRPGAYNLILVGERQIPLFSLQTMAQTLRSMLSPQGKVLVARDPALPSLGRFAGEQLRQRVNGKTAEERLVEGFALAGFTCRRYGAKLDDVSTGFHEFQI